MAKIVLEIENDYAFFVWGIVSTSRNHRLGWTVNKALQVDLKRDQDIEVISKSKSSRFHAIFTCIDDQFNVKYRLIENKKGVSRFLPEAKNADYLLVMDQSSEISHNHITSKLRAVSSIQMVFEIDLDKISQKQNILLAA